MKNIIPLIVSVILGLAAVYIVSKLIFTQNQNNEENKVEVVIAATNLAAHEEIQEGSVTYKQIPISAMPHNALLWENVNLAYGQEIPHNIAEGDYIFMNDIRIKSTLSDCTQNGEWMVPVTFADPTLVKMLMPDDEIAILATTSQKDKVNLSELANSDTRISDHRETTVLLPCVRIIGLANSNGNFREKGEGSGTVFVSLPPQQAMILIAAQRESELYPALRRRNDMTARNRKDGGVVNQQTFDQMRANLSGVTLPEIPGRTHK